MVVDCAWTENDVEFGANQVLEHCANEIRASAMALEFAGLVEQVVDVGAE